MSNFQPNAARWDIPEKRYQVVSGIPGGDTSPEFQHTHEFLSTNESEIINWAAFFRSYYGRGILCYRFKEGQYSYPPEYLQGRDLAWLPGMIIEDLDSMDLQEHYGFVLINEDMDLFHTVKWKYPEKITPLYKEGVEFKEGYSLEDDDKEILDSTDPVFLASRKAFLEGDFKKALCLVNQVIDKNPYYSRAYNARGNLYGNFQDLRFELAGYFDAIEVNPRNWRAFYNAGNLFFYIGEMTLGLGYLVHCLHYNPKFAEAVLSLARKLKWAGDIKGALIILEKGLKESPKDEDIEKMISDINHEIKNGMISPDKQEDIRIDFSDIYENEVENEEFAVEN